MARDISKRLGIGRVASAPDNDHVESNGGESPAAKTGSGVRHAMSGTGRQFSSPSSRLGDIHEFGGGSSSDYGKDFDEEDDSRLGIRSPRMTDTEQGFVDVTTDLADVGPDIRVCVRLDSGTGRRWKRCTAVSAPPIPTATTRQRTTTFTRADDPASTGDRTAANGCGDNDYTF
jgi:hypothetical protein